MVAGRIQENRNRPSPAGSDATALKSITAEEPDGDQT